MSNVTIPISVSKSKCQICQLNYVWLQLTESQLKRIEAMRRCVGSCNEKGLQEIGGIIGFIDTVIQRWVWRTQAHSIIAPPSTGLASFSCWLPSLYKMTPNSNTTLSFLCYIWWEVEESISQKSEASISFHLITLNCITCLFLKIARKSTLTWMKQGWIPDQGLGFAKSSMEVPLRRRRENNCSIGRLWHLLSNALTVEPSHAPFCSSLHLWNLHSYLKPLTPP